MNGRRSIPFTFTPRLLAALLLALLNLGGWASAGTGAIIRLPKPGVKNRTGLTVEISTKWVNGMGYRPIRVRIANQLGGPAPADRTLEVTFQPMSWYGGERTTSVTETIEFKQGDFYAVKDISVPQVNNWNRAFVETREDGRVLRELTSDHLGLGNVQRHDSPDTIPTVVVVHWAADDPHAELNGTAAQPWHLAPDQVISLKLGRRPVLIGATLIPWITLHTPDAFDALAIDNRIPQFRSWRDIEVRPLPDIRVLASRFPENFQRAYGNASSSLEVFAATSTVSNVEIRRLVADLPNIDLIPPIALPDRWLDLTNIDVLIIGRRDLVALGQRYPVKLDAIRTWLSTGTVLIVYDMGDGPESRSELDQLLKLEPTTWNDQEGKEVDPWRHPDPKDHQHEVEATKASDGTTWLQQHRRSMGDMSQSAAKGVAAAPAEIPFRLREAGHGTVMAMATANPFPGTELGWNWIFNSAPPSGLLAYQRLGMSHYQDNVQFWNFLIEGIGRAPVKSFLVLITLFAIVIGPFNYIVLQRHGRLSLLLVTVPFGAIVVAGTLFLFAMFADGLGTRVRLRSFTDLDQRRERAVTWSRQSYYAGFAPSSGLSYPRDAMVLPVHHRPVNRQGSSDFAGELQWGTRQNLVNGFFRSRQVSQFVVVEPREAKARLVVQDSPGGDGLQVTNELGAEVELLLLRNAPNSLCQVERLGPGETRAAESVAVDEVQTRWNHRSREASPRFPPEFDVATFDDVSGFFGGNYRVPSHLMPPSFASSHMEAGIYRSTESNFSELKPGQYVAILRQSPFVSMGLAEVGEERGFHVLVGRWK